MCDMLAFPVALACGAAGVYGMYVDHRISQAAALTAAQASWWVMQLPTWVPVEPHHKTSDTTSP